MANFIYTRAKAKVAEWCKAEADVRVLLVGIATTCDTEEDMEFLAGFATLDECNATNYVRKALANEVIISDLINNRGEYMADPVTWTALGGAVDFQVVAAVFFLFVTNDANSYPIAYFDTSIPTLPRWTNGSDFKITPNAEGLIQVT
jgi:hypothetical protein